ncbi:hypothetical protein LCGC14_1805880 [marine sediment metagenome]|uniref:Uncharacterized protein n=1 Tax=marine sediment metagenome TaxID=412755 RepID=A0A0F9JMY1_9ZZZZ
MSLVVELLALLPLLAWGALATPVWSRPIGLRLMALVVLYAFFGGLVDMLHGVFAGLPYGIQIADLIEDGGEMIVASLIVAHAVTLPKALRRPVMPRR